MMSNCRLTVQGRKELACKLLTSTYVTLGFSPHSSLRRSTGCVSPERLIELFNTAPSLSTKKWSAERLVLSLQDWHDGLDTLLAREEVTAHFEFCRVLELLKGDPEALNEECSEWFELLVAKLLYERPTTNKVRVLFSSSLFIMVSLTRCVYPLLKLKRRCLLCRRPFLIWHNRA